MTEAALIGRLVGANYASRIRAERLIAAGRVVLAAFSLLAFGLDPVADEAVNADATHTLLVAYAIYAVSIATWVWLSQVPMLRLGLVAHSLDLLIFSLLTYLTEGPTSPFFLEAGCMVIAAGRRSPRSPCSMASVSTPTK